MRIPLPIGFVLTLAACSAAHAGPVSITDASITYTQNFDTLPTSGTPLFSQGTTVTGWYVYNLATNPPAPYGVLRVDNGSSSQTGSYSFGSTGSSDRAFGVISAFNSTGTSFRLAPALAMTNDTGADIASISLRYDSEQWRNGGSGQADTMTLQYGYGASFTAVSTWTNAGAAFNATSRIIGTTASALDGNAAANRTADIGGSIATPGWTAGTTLWVRWSDSFIAFAADSGMGIDNVRVGFTPASVVPEPSPAALLLAGAGIVAGVARRRRPAR